MNLDVASLAFGYRNHDVLREISFSIDKGECLAVLGTNGVGKSTLLKCINRILRQQGGKTVVMGEDINRLSARELAKRIGYVSQNSHSFMSTVFDAILLGRKPYIQWDVTEEDMHIVHDVISSLDLEEFSLRYLDELSGGERQKVSIGRALAQHPDILLFDEPTSNLDLKNQLEVIQIIRNIVKTRQISAVVTMHDLNMALRFADRFILMKDGHIHAMGDAEVLSADIIHEVYGVHVTIQRYREQPFVIPV